jgi:hypothetical protein
MTMVVEKQLLQVARRLPADRFREVMDFAEFLLARPAPRRGNGSSGRRGALRLYIGGVNHGQLARGLD